MLKPSIPPGRLFVGTIVLSAPAFIALAVLVASDALRLWPAIGAMALAIAATFVIARTILADLHSIRAYLLQLARRGEAPPPRLRPGTMNDLAQVASRLWQAMAAKSETLNQQVEATAHLLDSLPVPVITLGDDLHVRDTNLAARRLLARDARGRHLAQVVRDPEVLEAAQRARVRDERVVVEFVQSDPMERYLSARLQRLRQSASDGAELVMTLQDMTSVRRSERMRSDFIANASHELRTPLSSLVGYIETLKTSARDDAGARERFLDVMQQQAERITRLVDDLMSLSRIEQDEHAAPTEVVDLGVVVQRVAEALHVKAASRNVRIQIDLPDSEVDVIGDEDQLQQVFQNLVDNAIKYGSADSKVFVSVKTGAVLDAGGGVEVTVRDEGEGIASEHLPRLTERFYRVDTARSREMGGTGLGLAIVKHIVSRHRGTLSIESDLGRGSAFIVTLPAAAESAAA